MKSIKQRILSTLLACSLTLLGVTANMSSNSTMTASAASDWKFDFGGSGTSSGYTGVSATDGYDAGKGYGFANTGAVSNVNAGGSGAGSDAVAFNNDDIGNTFNVDLPKGLYQVTVTTGNAPRCSIKMEGMLQIINVTGLNATETVQIPVTDGQLNIQAVTGMTGREHSIAAVEITQLNDTGVMNPHIWICGDSTVANYYNCDDTSQHGWGQFLGNYLQGTTAEGYVIRNMAASGQYAKGFVDAGQFNCIESYGKSGDYYIISIGINDTNYSNADEYTQVVTDMVQRAKKKGMEVILVKQQGRRSDLSRDKLLSGRWFGGQMDAIGEAENVKVIDLFNPWQDFGLSIGFDGMADYYAIQADGSNDDLHQSKMGSVKLAELVSELIFTISAEEGSLLEDEPEYFMLRNGSSGQYLSLESAPQNGTNVVQLAEPGIDSGYAVWKTLSAGDGYFYICNLADESKRLDVSYAAVEDGTNIGIWNDTNSDAQLYKFLKQDDGSYVIATKVSGDKSAIEVKNASAENGENIQEWERNGHACQTWFLDRVTFSADDVIPGDMNGDGVVDIFDEALLKREVQNSTHTHNSLRSGDLNGDAVLDVEDVKIINNFVLGIGNIPCIADGKQIYYAIDQAYNKGNYENTNANFTSEAYVNLDNNDSSFIEFKVTVPSSGNYLCTFRIANGSAINRQMKVQVNDNVDYWMQDFLSTETWTNWNERALVLPLAAGENLIRLTSATAEGGPNIDYLRTEWTDEPIAETYIPQPEPDPQPVPSNTTIYIAGDSTVQSYRESYAPQQGWGYYLGEHFSDNVTVSNHAIAGRSSKSFYDNGRLQTILDSIQPGDYLMVQFAINDSAASNEERYAPVCGNVDNPAEGSYEWYMTQYIKGAQEKGATPILVTTVIGLGAYANNTFSNSYTSYCDACKQLAAKYNCPCIDLNSLMVSHYNNVGYDTAYTYHMISTGNGSTDKTHFTETGASVVAGLVADAIRTLNLPISSEVK